MLFVMPFLVLRQVRVACLDKFILSTHVRTVVICSLRVNIVFQRKSSMLSFVLSVCSMYYSFVRVCQCPKLIHFSLLLPWSAKIGHVIYHIFFRLCPPVCPFLGRPALCGIYDVIIILFRASSALCPLRGAPGLCPGLFMTYYGFVSP
jgi:hypothetical protein